MLHTYIHIDRQTSQTNKAVKCNALCFSFFLTFFFLFVFEVFFILLFSFSLIPCFFYIYFMQVFNFFLFQIHDYDDAFTLNILCMTSTHKLNFLYRILTANNMNKKPQRKQYPASKQASNHNLMTAGKQQQTTN